MFYLYETHEFLHKLRFKHHMVRNARLIRKLSLKVLMEGPHMNKIRPVILTTHRVHTFIVLHEGNGPQKEGVAIDDQIPLQNPRNDKSGVQFQQLLQIPAIPITLSMMLCNRL